MEPHRLLALCLRLLHHRKDLFQRHFRTVIDRAVFFRVFKKLWIHQGTRIDDHIRLFDQPKPPDRDQIRRAAAGAYKIDHVFPFLWDFNFHPGIKLLNLVSKFFF